MWGRWVIWGIGVIGRGGYKKGREGAESHPPGSDKRGSNPRPSAWEADALPTELLPQISPQLAVAVALAKLEQISRFSKFFAIYRLFEGV